MPSFRYSGVAASGRNVAGTIDAESARAARSRLREREIFASEVTEEVGGTVALGSLRDRLVGRIGPTQVSRVIRQLATLLSAGVPLADAVASIRKRQTNATMSRALEAIGARLKEGETLAGSFANHPNVFPGVYIGMVEAGEASGALENVLRRIADHAEGQARLASRLRTALTYPTIMFVVGSAIVTFLLAYVVPQVTRVFADANQGLPLPTRVLMAVGDFLGNYILLLLLLVAVAGLGLRRLLRSPGPRRRAERIFFAMPWLGPVVRDISTARFAQTLATMVGGGLPLVEALRIARSSSGSLLLEDALTDAEEAVLRGESLAGHLTDNPLFDPMVVDMIAVGESSGDLESMLAKAAEGIDEQVSTSLETMAALLEPVMILIMASVVLFVVLAIVLPVFEMNRFIR